MARPILLTFLAFVAGAAGGVAGSHMLPAPAPVGTAVQPTSESVPISRVPAVAGGPDGIADLVDRVRPAVVNIDTEAHRKVAAAPSDPFEFFFGGPGRGAPMEQLQKGVGSGFVIKADGLVVTNFHVVRGADKLTVTLPNGNKYTGKVVGRDPATDLALVKVDAKNLPTLALADPKTLRVGQAVIAVGSPLGLQQTVTSGILSAVNRNIGLNSRVSFLQTDAAINPGNSGGPLLNQRGEVIGVNTAIAAQGQGIGFAIPVDLLQVELPQLESKGAVAHSWLGVGVSNLPEDRSQMFYPADYGVLVGRVDPSSPAGKAGIQPGDILMTFNGKKLTDSSMLVQEVAKLPPGSNVDLEVSRAGQQKHIAVKVERMPDNMVGGEQGEEGGEEGGP